MKTIASACAGLMLANCLAACSVYMEATRPSAVDLNDFRQGIYRDAVVKRLGPPDSTAVESDGASCDHYELYTRGYGTKGKIAIASVEGTVDLLTIGLAEVVLTPTEALTKSKKYPVAFCYHGDVLARVTGEGKPDVAKPQTQADNASPAQTYGAQAVATPAASPGLAAANISAPSMTSNPQVGNEWRLSDQPQ
jgi:hypothetical protein